MTPAVHREAMIAVGPGEATLSDRRTQHRWTVELAPYLLAAVPVTQAQYAAVTGQWPGATRDGELPVEGVSWLAAAEYCNALSRRAGLTPVYAMSAGDEDVHRDPVHAVGGKEPNAGGSTTCSATSGSGAGTSTIGRSTAATACCGAAAIDDVGFRVARSGGS